MEWILRMAVRTLLDSEGEKTLYDVRRFLEEAPFRSRVLSSVKDPRLRRFWRSRLRRRRLRRPPPSSSQSRPWLSRFWLSRF